jgi:hypothetical protein
LLLMFSQAIATMASKEVTSGCYSGLHVAHQLLGAVGFLATPTVTSVQVGGS